MPKNNSIKKVLVIGSGPIVIGQAAEFDYAGTQACRSLKEEGIEVVLVNSNPATIMTDKQIADKVYIEPLTTEVLKKIIKKEEPDSILPTLGGQAALNLAMELDESGFLVENRVRMIGTSSQTIKKAEDRLAFKETMESHVQPVKSAQHFRDVLILQRRTVIRLLSDQLIHWAAAAAVLPMMHSSCMILPAMV